MSNGKHIPTDLDLDSSESSLDLEQIWFVLREKAWFIALFGLVGIFAGLAYIHRTPLTYVAQSVIQVDPDRVKVTSFDEVQQSKDPISEEMGQTLLAMFKSRSFAEQVIGRYKLLEDPEFLPPGPGGKPPTMEEGIGALIGASRVSIRPGTRFIDINVQQGNPRMAKKLADILADAFIKEEFDQRAATSDEAIKYLIQKKKELQDNLQKSETALEDYRETHKSVSLDEKQDTVVSELKNQNIQLGSARSARMRLEADDEEIQKHLDDPQALLAIPSVADHPTIIEYRKDIADIESKIVTLSLRYTEKHPKMIQARSELADAKQKLRENLLKLPPLIHASYQAAVAAENKFGTALQDQEKMAMELNKQSIPYNVLLRDSETDRALYESILKRLGEVNIATDVELTNVHIFEKSLLPTTPLQPPKSRTLAISLAGGLLLGILISLGLNFLDSSVKTVDQAEQILGMTVLSAIPRWPQSRLKEGGFSLVKDSGSAVAEAFRSLRTALYLAGRDRGRKIVLFTSALAGEGKTFCSVNYATALAQQGLNTLLIDADLRSPMVASVLLQGKNFPGLTGLLSKKLELDQALTPSGVENLTLLMAGELVQNPAELLARSDFGDIIKQFAGKYERIVIDTAPVTAVSDTLLLIEHAQAICLVARSGKTPRKWILRAIKLLTEAGSKPTGVVLNQMPQHMAGAYSYYPGSYGEPGVYRSPGDAAPKPRDDQAAPVIPDQSAPGA